MAGAAGRSTIRASSPLWGLLIACPVIVVWRLRPEVTWLWFKTGGGEAGGWQDDARGGRGRPGRAFGPGRARRPVPDKTAARAGDQSARRALEGLVGCRGCRLTCEDGPAARVEHLHYTTP